LGFFLLKHGPSFDNYHIKVDMVDYFDFSNFSSTFDSFHFNGFNVEKFIDEMEVEAFMLFQVTLVAMTSSKDFFTTT
jgi:hypothetical protein